METYHFNLNGHPVQVRDIPSKRLLDVLREHFHCMGVKEGCGEGACGACSVLLNHEIVNSCITPLAHVEGQDVMTIEGVMHTKRGIAISKAFEALGSVQCGICTPGMIIATESLLHHNKAPNEDQIKAGFSGNLCRCTGYQMIIKGVQQVIEEAGDLW